MLGLIVVQLLMAGCEGGGGGVFGGLFGGGDAGDAGAIGDLASAGLGDGGGAGVGGGGGDGLVSEVATVHSPEPASVVLFGGGLGLAGLAHLRRRKAQRTKPTRH